MGRSHQHATVSERAIHDQTNLLPRSQLIVVFTALSLTLLIAFIDQNGISVSLPTIAADLNAEDTISWAGTTSLVANTMFQMLYGRLSDIFGRKAVYLTAIATLIVADILCGVAQNAASFYVFRGLAGIGGGGITNLSMIIISDIVTLEQRGKYQGIIGAMVGLGNVAGPFIGAAFIQKTGSWRGFFYMLAPLGAVVWVITFFLLPSKPPSGSFQENARKVDYMGSFTSSLGVIFLLIPISGGGAYFPWYSPMVISMLVIGSLAMIVFIIIEWKLAKLPMMPLAIFSNPVTTIMLVQSFLFGAVYQSYLYYVPMYLQNAHQFSPTMSAAISVALMGLQTVTSVLSGQYISRMKRYGDVIQIGFGSWTLGSGLTLLLDRKSNPGIIIIPLMFVGFGVGCIFQPTLVALQAHSTKSRRAVIISNRNFFRCFGGACGLAVSAAVLQAVLRANLPPKYAYLADETYAVPRLSGDDKDGVLDAYMAASRAVFILQIPLIGLCLLGCVFIKDNGLEAIDERPNPDAVEDGTTSTMQESQISSTENGFSGGIKEAK
ncbi:major facilitator superfamily domain-containing protein [Ilyonectria destructans]|nr:major facilitator superfamily domain-containing protein [Ilyonectria destructans]